MKLSIFLTIAIAAIINSGISRLENRLIWSTCVNNTCTCGDKIHGTVECKGKNVKILRCYSMYYNNFTNKTELGTSLFTCFNPQRKSHFKVYRYSVSNYSAFNEEMCNPVSPINNRQLLSHRVGRFCGKCQQNYGLAVYSYHLSSCVPCWEYKHISWLKYIAIALGPLTVFYFIVALFGVNLAAGKMNGLIFSVQIIMSPIILIVLDAWIHSQSIECKWAFKIIAIIFGPVNLDFFRGLYPEFCISPSFNVVQILALEYIIALYPFLLILITYLLIKLYDKNFHLIVVAWKPFKYLLKNKHWNAGNTLVETFCTFIHLSSLKIVGTTIALLCKAKSYDEHGKALTKEYLFIDASIQYFGPQHCYISVVAIIICFVFVFLPFLLLLIYPCKIFQKLMNLFGATFHPLHVFMDAVQGCYRTTPVDLRYFSAFYLFLCFLCQTVIVLFKTMAFLPITTFILMVSSLIFAVVQPYKDRNHNRLDLVCLLLATLFYASATLMVLIFYLDKSRILPADVIFGLAFLSIFVLYTFMLLYIIFGHSLKNIFKQVSFKPFKYCNKFPS